MQKSVAFLYISNEQLDIEPKNRRIVKMLGFLKLICGFNFNQNLNVIFVEINKFF